jgi:very-short-patch-repair endonuclease
VSHEAAAALLGRDRALPGRVEFTVRRGRHHSLDGVRVHTTMHVGPHDVITVDGLRCSSATRTIIDLAALRVPQVRLAAAIDSAIRRRLSARSVIAERLARLRARGRHGVTAIDRLLPDTGGESPLERAFLRLMRQHRLPRPTTQHRVHGPNGLVGRVDFVYSDLRVVVEVTGRRGHASDAERQRDAQRRNELIDEGFRVYEYTRSDLEERADWVAETMRSRLCAARSRRDAIGRHTDDP